MTDKIPPWPPTQGLTTPHVPRAEAVLTTRASTRINAPAAAVFETVLDAASYGAWNQFCPRVSIHSQPPDALPGSSKLQLGSCFTFSCVMDSSKPTKFNEVNLKVMDISTPSKISSYIPPKVLEDEPTYTAQLDNVYRISWMSDDHGKPSFMSRGLKAERFHEIIVLGETECEVRTWENQSGVLAYAVRRLYKKTLQDKFQMWCDDLKSRSEEMAKASDGKERREED